MVSRFRPDHPSHSELPVKPAQPREPTRSSSTAIGPWRAWHPAAVGPNEADAPPLATDKLRPRLWRPERKPPKAPRCPTFAGPVVIPALENGVAPRLRPHRFAVRGQANAAET